MQFYSIEYITAHQSLASVLRSISIILLLIIVIASSIYYMRNKIRTRWRDISMVLLTLILFGIQMQEYIQSNQDFSQSQVLIKFIESVATDNNLKPKDVLVSATSLSDGIIVRYNKEDYRVHLNEDNNSYTLERTHVIDHNVYVDEGGA